MQLTEIEVWILIERHSKREGHFSCVYAVCKKKLDMATKRISIARILTSLAPLKSWRPQLSNDAKIVKIRAILTRFVSMFWFLLVFVAKNAKKRRNWPQNVDFQREKIVRNRAKIKTCPWNWSVGDDFGVVGKLGVPAFQRRHSRQNPSSRRSIRDHVLIRHPHFLSADAASVQQRV